MEKISGSWGVVAKLFLLGGLSASLRPNCFDMVPSFALWLVILCQGRNPILLDT